uniref:Uncharacterized protein n=1 Tax=Chromera velia CCMP2878 TaxID=1169474 RepID=A0A0G4FHM7_9ALVE|eukprot:Cvel_17009.t1-p1 / transcript=Cvel_17009.t1 / gene=Cvel_17009 / organism=Chromera_velia_CCMP2878 / gene_product=hypothetical protein / transcript_product=hypothetical protein / location=Cvel_scaffold1337:4300-6773(-) / protein_length=534 / sequence_SO=supercontig / SO=protein_coding / is_pseudo=false
MAPKKQKTGKGKTGKKGGGGALASAASSSSLLVPLPSAAAIATIPLQRPEPTNPPPPLPYADPKALLGDQEKALEKMTGWCKKGFSLKEWYNNCVPPYVKKPANTKKGGGSCVTCILNRLQPRPPQKGSNCCAHCEFWWRENLLLGGSLEGLSISDIPYGCSYNEVLSILKFGPGFIEPLWGHDLVARKQRGVELFAWMHRTPIDQLDRTKCWPLPRPSPPDWYEEFAGEKLFEDPTTHPLAPFPPGTFTDERIDAELAREKERTTANTRQQQPSAAAPGGGRERETSNSNSQPGHSPATAEHGTNAAASAAVGSSSAGGVAGVSPVHRLPTDAQPQSQTQSGTHAVSPSPVSPAQPRPVPSQIRPPPRLPFSSAANPPTSFPFGVDAPLSTVPSSSSSSSSSSSCTGALPVGGAAGPETGLGGGGAEGGDVTMEGDEQRGGQEEKSDHVRGRKRPCPSPAGPPAQEGEGEGEEAVGEGKEKEKTDDRDRDETSPAHNSDRPTITSTNGGHAERDKDSMVTSPPAPLTGPGSLD